MLVGMEIRAVVYTTADYPDRPMFDESVSRSCDESHPEILRERLGLLRTVVDDLQWSAIVTIAVPDEDVLAVLDAEAIVRGSVS
jgi:hypothetical protein